MSLGDALRLPEAEAGFALPICAVSYSYAPPCGPALLVTQDPSATLAVHCVNGFDAGQPLSKYSFEPIQCCVS
jgi:hypothetical protein